MLLSLGFTSFQLATPNPTGTYRLGHYSTKRTGKYFGEIQIKQLDGQKIAISFYVNKGAPSYNSGSFVDTLNCNGDLAIYATQHDPSCKITFKFAKPGVQVTEQADDFNSGCGFGYAVVANGFFKRVSTQVPVMKDIGTGEKLK
jgi:hypothetical protein